MSTNDQTLRLAVIGHTNTGKTSVLRTLLRDASLGEVVDEAGTTRTNASYSLMVEGREMARLWDTPGLENAAAALRALREHDADSTTAAEALQRLIDAASGDLRRELAPLDALKRAHAGLLVFDARESPKAKHWEEHELLRRCGRPLVAVLNCVNTDRTRTDAWDQALRENGLHAVVRFDAWAADERDASKLFVKIREMLGDDWHAAIDRIIKGRAAAERRRLTAMCDAVAALAVDAASYRLKASRDDLDRAGEELRSDLATAWSETLEALASLHGVKVDQVRSVEAELDRALSEESGPSATDTAIAGGATALAALVGGAAAGAAHGGVVDLGTGGLTLGLGVVLGGAAGLAIGGREIGRQALMRARGEVEIGYSREAVAAVVARGMWLVDRLRLYGLASERPIQSPPDFESGGDRAKRVKSAIDAARRKRGWSRLTPSLRRTRGPRPDASRDAIERLAAKLLDTLPSC